MNQGKIVVINIVSVSYSGSTWLNLMLGSHERSFSVGEIKSIARHGRAVCKFHGDKCPVWSRYKPGSDQNPFVQISELTGKKILVVNNSREFWPALRDDRIDARWMHLVRDGRAVAASMLRKYPQQTMWHAARHWARGVRKSEQQIKSNGYESAPVQIYERLVEDPSRELESLCESLRVPYDPSMVQYADREHHFLGGNRGTLTALARRKNTTLAEFPTLGRGSGRSPKYDLDHYKDQDPKRFVDARWKRELSDLQLRVFALAAGRVNRKLGYPGSLDRRSEVSGVSGVSGAAGVAAS